MEALGLEAASWATVAEGEVDYNFHRQRSRRVEAMEEPGWVEETAEGKAAAGWEKVATGQEAAKWALVRAAAAVVVAAAVAGGRAVAVAMGWGAAAATGWEAAAAAGG